MKKILFIFFVLLTVNLSAKNITGIVNTLNSDGSKEPITGAIVIWADNNKAVVTDENGLFRITKSKNNSLLIAQFIGFANDSIKITDQTDVEFTLKSSTLQIEQVKVTSRKSNSISNLSMEKKEMITFAGLCKMACCNIAESFENSASVTVGYSDAVSGARQIKLLGYAGMYTQMLDEARPISRGLGATYGLEHTPGMWLQGIQISKGVTSVVNGYEALTGQINLEHRKPTDDTPLFVNLFLSSELRSEINVTSSHKINDKLSTVILSHASLDKLKSDHNNDGFLDMPLKEQYNVANRWLYQADNGTQIRYGVKVLYEDREGGQMDYKSSDRGTTNYYGSNITNKHFNAYIKAGFPLKRNTLEVDDPLYAEETTSNIAIIADYVYHEQDAFFGIKDYSGAQNSAYANLLYQINVGSKHQFIAGATFTADLYNENLTDRYTIGKDSDGGYRIDSKDYDLSRDLFTVGAFGEYTLKIGDKFDMVAGVRADHNNKYGFMFTPRGHVKYDITPSTTLRGSAGVGYRIMSLVTDNIGMLATGRSLSFAEDLNPLERGFTAGASITQKFKFFNDPRASINLDYFRSEFSNQVIVDQESDSNKILFYNLNGESYTNTYQIDFSYEPFTRFTIFATYRYNDTKVTLKDNIKVETPLIDRFKGLINIQYATNYDKWIFDFTAQINGQTRLPVQDENIAQSTYSKVYPMFFAQVTKKFKKIDVYVGCENIANFRQDNPIISASDPFSSKFNSTVIWGPIMGRKFYAGLRYTL